VEGVRYRWGGGVGVGGGGGGAYYSIREKRCLCETQHAFKLPPRSLLSGNTDSE